MNQCFFCFVLNFTIKSSLYINHPPSYLGPYNWSLFKLLHARCSCLLFVLFFPPQWIRLVDYKWHMITGTRHSHFLVYRLRDVLETNLEAPLYHTEPVEIRSGLLTAENLTHFPESLQGRHATITWVLCHFSLVNKRQQLLWSKCVGWTFCEFFYYLVHSDGKQQLNFEDCQKIPSFFFFD